MDPAKRFVENCRQSYETQWAMSNLFQKISKISAFLTKTAQKTDFVENYLKTPLN